MYFFTKVVLIKYICSKCKNPQWSKVDIPKTLMIDTEHIIEYITSNEIPNRLKTCNNCNSKNTISISYLEILPIDYDNVSDDIYGDISVGRWICIEGHIEKCYPGRIRMAALGIATSCFKDNDVYEEIISLGLPWKCPICKKPLTYIEKGSNNGLDK